MECNILKTNKCFPSVLTDSDIHGKIILNIPDLARFTIELDITISNRSIYKRGEKLDY